MKVISFGSLNIDRVYNVPKFVSPGETTACSQYQRFAGGKGANQSVAMKLAGVDVTHAGKVGSDGQWVKGVLESYGIDTSLIATSHKATGHAVVQVDTKGENCIIIHGGANHDIDKPFIHEVLEETAPGDWLVLQNEINKVPAIITLARQKGLHVVFSPAPFTPHILDYPIHEVHLLLLNQTEGQALTAKTKADHILSVLGKKYPDTQIILTQGDSGVCYTSPEGDKFQPAFKVDSVDATAAGDCFTGYLVAFLMQGKSICESVKIACAAAAISVTKAGAIESIPSLSKVERFLNHHSKPSGE